MFRHQGAILKEFNYNKVLEVQQVLYVLVVLTFIIEINI